MCTHVFTVFTNISMICFLKEKIILLSKESSFLEKKKNIYCAFPDMKEIIIKNWRNRIKDNKFCI